MQVVFILALFVLQSCSVNRQLQMGKLTGKVDIGPLCPQEPCNPTPERLKQVYDSYQVVLMDTAAQKTLYRISIESDGSFSKAISAGEYLALIKPVAGSGFKNESKRFSIAKGKTTDILLSYDTGLR